MNEKIKLMKSNGTTIEGDIICFLEDILTSKRYVYYTLNEVIGTEPSSTVKIYVAKVKQNDATDTLISEEEWIKLKGIMGEVLKDTDNDTIKYLNVNELMDPTIIDEKVIAMPTMYDYISKHRGVYANKVATNMVSEPASTVEVPIQETSPLQEPIEASEPAIEPVAKTSIIEEVIPEEPQTTVPISESAMSPAEPIQVVEESPVPAGSETVATNLEKINVDDINAKYDKMVEDINNLRKLEIEAAERYNATLELNAMHIEQHASNVQAEQPAVNTTIEPVSISPTPIEPQVSDVNIETNWFDMQPQG